MNDELEALKKIIDTLEGRIMDLERQVYEMKSAAKNAQSAATDYRPNNHGYSGGVEISREQLPYHTFTD